MKDRLLTYLKYGNRFCGVELTTHNGNDSINALIIKQSKKELNLEKSFNVNSIDSLQSEVTKNQHVTLVINNNNVLLKVIENENHDSLKLVHKAFPNIKIEDFYFEILSKENKHFISLCRKDYIDKLITKFSKLKLWVIDISLGNNLIDSISKFIHQNHIYSSNSKIEIVKGNLVEIKKVEVLEENYNVNGVDVSSKQLLSFCGALNCVLNSNNTKANIAVKKTKLVSDFNHNRFFNVLFKTGGLFILGLLLINFFFFNHYFKKVNELKQVSEINQTNKTKILKLNDVVSKKKKTVDDLLKSNGSKTSHYTNTIIHSLPESILLNEFNYQPLLKRIKANNEIELKENQIIITGVSNDSNLFSEWINELEQMDWIQNIDIIDYSFGSSKTSSFEIKIVLIYG